MKRILAPVDFSEGSDLALRQAIDLADRMQAELHVMHVAPIFDLTDERGLEYATDAEKTLYRRLREDAEARMSAMLAGMDTRGLHVRRVIAQGISAAGSTLEYASAEDVDLIVLSTHGRRGLRRFVIGSVAEEIVAGAEVPVLAVRVGTAEVHRSIQRILVPVDLSDLARHCAREARRLARNFGAQIDLLNVIEPLPYYLATYGGMTLTDLAPRIRDQAEIDMQAMAASITEDSLPVESIVVEGEVAREIVRAAERTNADLIVMARHRMGRIERLMLGSVTALVLRSAPCPVYVLPAKSAEIRVDADRQAVQTN
jgi:nucleotide-binding universal stress UspA family protein